MNILTVRLFAIATAALGAGGLSSVALAQAQDSALMDFVGKMEQEGGVERVVQTDLDGDDVFEALVVMAEKEPGAGQEWRFIHDKAGAPELVFTWMANDVRVVPDEKTEGRRVISSDWITFGYGYEDRFGPVSDMESMNGHRVSRASQDIIDAVAAIDGVTHNRETVPVLHVDLFSGLPGNEKVVMPMDEVFRDAEMRAPYYIFDSANAPIHQGWSLMGPLVYAHASGGISIVEQTLETYSLVYVPPPGGE